MTYRTLELSLTASLSSVAQIDLPSKRDAETAYARHRANAGFKPTKGQLLSEEIEKLKKGDGVKLVMLALAPAEASGFNVCPHSTSGCREFCVAKAGNGAYPAVMRARIARTRFLVENPREFLSLLIHTLDAGLKRNDLAVRLNGFSDIRWERVLPGWFWQRYNHVTFYDYTKHSVLSRPVDTMPANYLLTYSVTERTSDKQIAREMAAGRNIAVVVETKGGIVRNTGKLRDLPTIPTLTVDGDKNDRRFNDPEGSVVMLRRKGSLPVDNPLVVSNERLTRIVNSGTLVQ